jgi:predicted anti-sigma-YlaC factor YlaD
MTTRHGGTEHPDLQHYYDRGTDRAAVDAHLATCSVCRAWLDGIHERLRDLACSDVVELVTEFLDDAIDEGLRARIDDHLRVCEQCRSYLDQMRATIATLGGVSAASEPSEPVQAGLLAAFRAWRDGRPGSV